jgi:hypothetical protein
MGAGHVSRQRTVVDQPNDVGPRQPEQIIADSARALQRSSRFQLRKNLGSFGLGISGAAWSAVAGDVVGVVLGAGALLAGLGGARPQDINAYTYLFDASSKFR